jgi:hypothetical protein
MGQCLLEAAVGRVDVVVQILRRPLRARRQRHQVRRSHLPRVQWPHVIDAAMGAY